MQDDIDAGLLSGVEQVDVAMVNCVDGGAWDGGSGSGGDAGQVTDGAVEHDATSGSSGGSDASTGSGSGGGGSSGSSGGASSGGADAGVAGNGAAKTETSGGCACVTAPGAPSPDRSVSWILGAVFLARRVGRTRGRR
jgi:hypothetical protein